jgi:hypothetical protein
MDIFDDVKPQPKETDFDTPPGYLVDDHYGKDNKYTDEHQSQS